MCQSQVQVHRLQVQVQVQVQVPKNWTRVGLESKSWTRIPQLCLESLNKTFVQAAVMSSLPLCHRRNWLWIYGVVCKCRDRLIENIQIAINTHRALTVLYEVLHRVGLKTTVLLRRPLHICSCQDNLATRWSHNIECIRVKSSVTRFTVACETCCVQHLSRI